MSRFPKGTYRARAVADSHVLGRSKNKGTEQSTVEFELLAEGFVGQRISWVGYHTDKSWERTAESLRHAGWTGDDLSETPLPGLGSTEVDLVIDDEEYDGKTYSRVQFVNKPGALVIGTPMNPDEARGFAAKMRQRIAAQRAQSGKPAQGSAAAQPTAQDTSDIPF